MTIKDYIVPVTILLCFCLWLIFRYVIGPYIQLEVRRYRSRKIRPQPEQIWVQDGDLIYIDAVTPTGVEVIHMAPNSKTVNKWKDTWPEWETRVRNRSIWYTGRRQPLGPS